MRRAWKNTGITVVTVVALLFVLGLVWALVEPYTLDTERHEVVVPNLPESWFGKRVAVVTDFQIGMWLDNVSTMRRAVDAIIEEEPALVLITGDFIYHGGERAPRLISTAAEVVKPLTDAGLPVYAVLGNHDYSVSEYNPAKIDYDRAENLTEALEAVGVNVLVNESVEVDGLYVVGIGSHMIRNDKPEKAFGAVPTDAPRIVALHNPTSFGAISAGHAPLAVAGHTHGGQIRIPFTPEWSMLTFFEEEEVHADGWIDDYGARGNELYVNRGIGMSVVPMRLRCRPEVTVFTFTRDAPSNHEAGG
ncbi:MAG: metallophosphoesterase [Spirochaetales bacterium]